MLRRMIDCVEAQLGEPLRDHGPSLGTEFDELPRGAFWTPIGNCMSIKMLFLTYCILQACYNMLL
ncbi:hypothetical protein Hanom_Chr09g00825091 [Helianthus anomalus]